MNAVADPEVIELFAERPELLAIADAVAQTQQRRLRWSRASLLLTAAVAAVAVLALVAPWRSNGPSGLERALAAVGAGPVIHAVVEYSSPDEALIEIASGKERPRVHRTEYWFDGERRQLHTRLLVDGVQITEIVETPEQAYSDLGSWPTGGGFAPQLDPALAGFVTQYRESLESGKAQLAGTTTVEGRAALRLELRLERGLIEQVILDAETYEPLRFSILQEPDQSPTGVVLDPRTGTLSRSLPRRAHGRVDRARAGIGRRPEWRVVTIESLPRDPAFFAPPKLSPPRPTAGSRGPSDEVTLAEATRALGRPPLWLGHVFGGHALDSIELARPRTEWTDGRRAEGVLVTMSYGPVTVSEAVDTAAGYQLGFDDGSNPPAPAGFLEAAGEPPAGELRKDGMLLRIEAPDRATLLEAARALSVAR